MKIEQAKALHAEITSHWRIGEPVPSEQLIEELMDAHLDALSRNARLVNGMKDFVRQHHRWARNRKATAEEAMDVLVTIASSIESYIGADAVLDAIDATPDWQEWVDDEFVHSCSGCYTDIPPGEPFHSDRANPHRNRCQMCWRIAQQTQMEAA